MQLEGKGVIVTGGASGIGAAAVAAFAAEGARVASLDVLDDPGTGHENVRPFRCDVADRAQVEAAFDEAVAFLGQLDGLVHAAGVERHTPAAEISDDEWDLILRVNVTGTFLTNQVAFRHMRERGGRILNFGSDAGLISYVDGAHYSASKGAVHSWTRTVAGEWGKYGITANSVVPAMWTPMYDAHRAVFSAEELAVHEATMAAIIPLGGKLGDPSRDLAPVLVFLLGDGARFITGQILSVNGGLGMVR
jgi:NAD(P)-dependent dehydrogenase (short-subunit alcohol dehydrogenase family)